METSRFIKSVLPSIVLCSRCFKVMKRPRQCSVCNKWACSDCAIYMSNHDHKCEHAFTEVNKFLEDKIDALNVWCCYSELGCDYFSISSSMSEHEKTCQFGIKECVSKSCCRDTNVHVKDCDFATVFCENGCNKKLKRFEVNKTLLIQLPSHNCIESLKREIENNKKISKIYLNENEEMKFKLKSQNFNFSKELGQMESEIEVFEKENYQLKNELEEAKGQYEFEKENGFSNTMEQLLGIQSDFVRNLNIFASNSSTETKNLGDNIITEINIFLRSIKSSLETFTNNISEQAKDTLEVKAISKTISKTPSKVRTRTMNGKSLTNSGLKTKTK